MCREYLLCVYRLLVRVRSDSLILVWIPKGMNLRAFVETYGGMNIIENVIKKFLTLLM